MSATMTDVTLVDKGRVIGGANEEYSSDNTFWTDNVSCSIGDTSATIIDSRITTECAIDPYCKTASGKIVNISNVEVTTGQAILTFSELTEAANIKLNVINYNHDNVSIWSNAVSASSGDTTATITNINITTDSIVKIYSQSSSGNVKGYNSIVVTSGQIVLTFPALTEVTSFRARIFNI